MDIREIFNYKKGNTVIECSFCGSDYHEINLSDKWTNDEIISSPITKDFLDNLKIKPSRKELVKRKFEPEMMEYYYDGIDYGFRYKHEIENYLNMIINTKTN